MYQKSHILNYRVPRSDFVYKKFSIFNFICYWAKNAQKKAGANKPGLREKGITMDK